MTTKQLKKAIQKDIEELKEILPLEEGLLPNEDDTEICNMTTNTKLNKQKEISLSAEEIARYFLSLDPERKQFKEEKAKKLRGIAVPTIGNFRLNKLLHISQILYAAKYGK
ncbi:11728_t:CDS:2 [Racocetra fulgida]|uniref:11728_t:CDS:1 n=1 Tax=Racocetra fulgida TaxID=60492 RepID=A0A9N9F6K6_9GLOM|nr:11728_t:CDS:2 [Racocetra fulgida]